MLHVSNQCILDLGHMCIPPHHQDFLYFCILEFISRYVWQTVLHCFLNISLYISWRLKVILLAPACVTAEPWQNGEQGNRLHQPGWPLTKTSLGLLLPVTQPHITVPSTKLKYKHHRPGYSWLLAPSLSTASNSNDTNEIRQHLLLTQCRNKQWPCVV